MAKTETGRESPEAGSMVDELAAIDRRLVAIEKAVWALAHHAGVVVEPCPSCETGRLQYKIEKSNRTFGKVHAECDSCDHVGDAADEH